MNRLDPNPESMMLEPQNAAYSIEAGRYSLSTGGTPHALFAPLHYERNYAYPLVVWLHGPADNERQLKRIMPLVSMRNYVAVAARGTVPEPLPGGGFRWEQSENEIVRAEERVFDCIDLAHAKFNLHEQRVFVAGLGCGGTMAIRLALNHPHLFAGALSLGGPFPTNLRPLRHLNRIRQLPLFLANGGENPDYPQEQVCQDLRLFHSAGLSVSVRQYPCGAELTTMMLSDMDRWIMELVCPSTAACGR